MIVAAPEGVASVLSTDRVIRTERPRGISDQPLLAEEIFVAAARFAGFETLPEAELGPLLYPIYLDRFGVFIASAADDLRFGAADARTTRHLKVANGAHVLAIERTAFIADGTAVEWRRAIGPADRVHYRSRIS